MKKVEDAQSVFIRVWMFDFGRQGNKEMTVRQWFDLGLEAWKLMENLKKNQ